MAKEFLQKLGWPQLVTRLFQFFTSRHPQQKKKIANVLTCFYLTYWLVFTVTYSNRSADKFADWKTYSDIILDRADTFNHDTIFAFYGLITLHVTCVLTCSLNMLYISLSLQTWWHLVCHKFCRVIWDMFWNILQHFTCHKFWHLQLILAATYSNNNQFFSGHGR